MKGGWLFMNLPEPGDTLIYKNQEEGAPVGVTQSFYGMRVMFLEHLGEGKIRVFCECMPNKKKDALAYISNLSNFLGY